jgi:hypothetical protein
MTVHFLCVCMSGSPVFSTPMSMVSFRVYGDVLYETPCTAVCRGLVFISAYPLINNFRFTSPKINVPSFTHMYPLSPTDGQHAMLNSREVTMNRESWLPYTPEEKSRELKMRGRVLCWRAKWARHQNQKLRDHTARLLEPYRSVISLPTQVRIWH